MTKREKILTVIVIAQAIFFSTACFAVYEEYTAVKLEKDILFDNKIEKFDKPIVTINDVTYVPLREFCERLNWDVIWEDNYNWISVNSQPIYKEFQTSNELKYRYFDNVDYNFDEEKIMQYDWGGSIQKNKLNTPACADTLAEVMDKWDVLYNESNNHSPIFFEGSWMSIYEGMWVNVYSDKKIKYGVLRCNVPAMALKS